MVKTYEPKEPHVRASGVGLDISAKDAMIICRAIRKKTLKRSKRLLKDLIEKRRSLTGKYYSKACEAIMEVVESCEKNAEFKGLDQELLFVHASAHKGMNIKRRRRKSGFGSRMKRTNIEIILIERGKKKMKKENTITEKVGRKTGDEKK